MYMHTVIYPGTFDPITNGHIDIIKRILNSFDSVVVAVSEYSEKKILFNISERVNLIKRVLSEFNNLQVVSFKGLLVDYIKKKGIKIIIRGIRHTSDFNYEYQMSKINSYLDKNIETIFLVAHDKYSNISSSAVKEIAKFNLDRIESFVHPLVFKALKAKKSY